MKVRRPLARDIGARSAKLRGKLPVDELSFSKLGVRHDNACRLQGATFLEAWRRASSAAATASRGVVVPGAAAMAATINFSRAAEPENSTSRFSVK
jgi:hypothetical protein